MKSTPPRKDLGFTILELLLTITIISVLSVVLLPNLTNARKKSNESAVQAYVRDVAMQVEILRPNDGSVNLDMGNSCHDYSDKGPTIIKTCTVSINDDNVNFSIQATASNTSFNAITFDSATAGFSFKE